MEQQASYRALLEVRGVSALIFATTMSRPAGRMFALTLLLFVLARFSSPILAGWLTFAAIAPGLAGSPIAGALLDRMGPTMAVKADLVASAVFVATVSISRWAGCATPPLLFALMMLFSSR